MFKTLIGLLLILTFSIPVQAQQARSRGEEPFLPYAVWYGGGKARAPMLEAEIDQQRDEWRADLQKIKELGFNSIRCWVDWSTAEPEPGQFNFRHVDQLLELAREAGLKVIIQVYMDSAPDWVGVRYPDSQFVANNGDVIVSQAAPGYCFDHAGVQKATLGFYSALARHVGRHPAFYGWDLWSEPHIINWATMQYMVNPEFCFCAHTSARFRQWLKGKYGTLEAINRSWYRRFTAWEQIEPARFSTILSYSDFLDWRYFVMNKLAEDLQWRAEAVLKEAPKGVVTSHAAAPSLFTSPMMGAGAPDDWRMAKVIQYWGTSFYPKHSSPVGQDAVVRAARLDFTKSSGYRYSDGFYIGEMQTGFGTVGLRVSPPVTPADLEHWAWSALSRGAKGINFYAFYPMSSGYESGGFGLIQLDGRLTERSKTAGAIGRIVTRKADLFLKARPAQAEAAIMYNSLPYMVGGPRRIPFPGAQDEYGGVERDSWMGLYRALFPLNLPIDYVHAEDVGEGGLKGYRLLYVPYPVMMSEKTARGIAQFIEQGGSVVMEARGAWNDERGYATPTIPGFGLDQIFGARELSVLPVQKTQMTIAPNAGVGQIQAGLAFPGQMYQEALEPIGANSRVVAKFDDGTPAIVASTHGRGKTLFVGSFLSMAFERNRDANLARFIQGLIDWAGIKPWAQSTVPDIEMRRMDGPGYSLCFIFNNGQNEASPELTLETPFKPVTVRDLVTGQDAVHRVDGSRVVYRTTLAPQGVRVLEIREKR